MIRKLFPLAALTFLLASCTNAIDNVDNLWLRAGVDSELPVFYATIEGSDDAATKVFADDQMRVLWNADDRITVFNKYSYGYEYSFTGQDGNNAGEFKAVPVNGTETGNPLDHVYALYPHNSITKISNDGVITVTLPATQTYKANSFGIGANTMLSVTDDTQLRFKNVGGYLSFKLYGENVSVKSISLKGNLYEKLAGKACITMPVGGTPDIEMQDDGTESITLTCETPVVLGTDADHCTEFWFVLPPTTFPIGFKVTITDSQGRVFEKSTSETIRISRNNLSRMSPMEVVPEYRNAIERNALIEFYQAMGGENWIHKDNWCSGKPLDEWYGIQADADDNVEVIDLQNNNLSGALTSDLLKDFSKLVRLVLSNNNIPEVQLKEIHSITQFYVFDIPAKKLRITNCSSLIDFGASGEMEEIEITQCENLAGIGLDDCHSIKTLTLSGLDNLKNLGLGHSPMDALDLSALPGLESLCCDGISTIDVTKCTKLRTLLIGSDFLSSLDISNNSELECLWLIGGRVSELNIGKKDKLGALLVKCNRNIKSLDVSGCPNLTELIIDETDIQHLDISHCPHLQRILADYTLLSDIDLSLCKDLIEFTAINANLTQLDVSKCPKLEILQPFGNHIDKLNVQNNPNLRKLYCYDCNLEELDISSNCELRELQCGKNNIKSLDTQSLPALEKLYCADTQLESLDISTNYKLETLVCTGTPQLETIYIYPGQTLDIQKDEATSFQEQGVNPALYYESTDYSNDKTVKTLQTAKAGNGINVVILGDGFSDRLVADGTFDTIAEKTKDALFKEEPYKSFSDLFNVYSVTAISRNEEYQAGCATAFSVRFPGGSTMEGNHTKVADYAALAIPESSFGNSIIIVVANKPVEGGTCYWFAADASAISYVPLGVDNDNFQYIISHEAGGHGFAHLADEYPSGWGISIDEDLAAGIKSKYYSGIEMGWYQNVDITSDPEKVKWSEFLKDERYSNENLGVYEGAFTVDYGMYRPSWNSIMRYGIGGFNAPSRYTIWKRINRVAYGEEWTGSYEDFVTYDAINRTPAAVARMKAQSDHAARPRYLHTPPVIVGRNWREAASDK